MTNKLDTLKPMEESVILFNSTGKDHEDIRFLNDKRYLQFNLVTRLAIKDKPFPRQGLYTFKGVVQVNLEKVNKDIQNYEDLSSDLKIYCGQLVASIRRGSRKGTLREDFNIIGISDEYLNSLKPKEIISIVFAQKDDVITFTNMAEESISISKEDYELYKRLKKLHVEAKGVYQTARETGYTIEDLQREVKLPVHYRILPYISIDKTQSFVNIQFSYTTEDVEGRTNGLLNLFIGEIERQTGVSIVNLKASKSFIRLGLLCDNIKLNNVLNLLGSIYKRYKYPFVENYIVEIEITKNIGYEEETKVYYSIIEGNHFKPLKDLLEPTGEVLFGFNVYK
ncbi:hypothetical protein ACQUY5_25095 [Bacillus cereus]|uniref:hypothetical protein n=1 Tax=Bacillus cereus TaxID=1396 RepID=UPI003D17E7CF